MKKKKAQLQFYMLEIQNLGIMQSIAKTLHLTAVVVQMVHGILSFCLYKLNTALGPG